MSIDSTKPSYPTSEIEVRRAREEELPLLIEFARRDIGQNVASLDVVEAVHKHNSDSFWLIVRRHPASGREDVLGFYSFLMLNALGLRHFEDGTFDARNPPLDMMAPGGTRPVALYIWGVVAKGLTAIATVKVAHALGAPLYGSLPLYATAATFGGAKRLANYGFTAVGGNPDSPLGAIYRFGVSNKMLNPNAGNGRAAQTPAAETLQ